MGQIKNDGDRDRGRLTLDRREMGGLVAPDICKRPVVVDDRVPFVRSLRNTTEAISAIAAGERDRSFRQKRLDGTLLWTIRINRG